MLPWADIQRIAGQSLILLGLAFTGFGVYTVLRFDRFYARMVITSKVEAMGFVTVVLGAMVLSGFTPTSAKLGLLLLFELLTVSVSAHAIARSAWISGFRIRTADEPPGTGAAR